MRFLSDFIKGENVVKSTFLPFLFLDKLYKTIKKEGQTAPLLPLFLVLYSLICLNLKCIDVVYLA